MSVAASTPAPTATATIEATPPPEATPTPTPEQACANGVAVADPEANRGLAIAALRLDEALFGGNALTGCVPSAFEEAATHDVAAADWTFWTATQDDRCGITGLIDGYARDMATPKSTRCQICASHTEYRPFYERVW